MAANPFTVDPVSGSIYAGQGNDISGAVDSVFLNGSPYTLQGSTLVPDIAGFPNINLPANAPSRIWADPEANTHISHPVDRRQINSTGVASRTYGIGGTVNFSLADGSVISVELDNTVLTKAGTRLFQTIDADGNIQVSETGYNFGTNRELQEALNNAQARYLSPLEALRELVFRNLGNIERDEVMRYMESHKEALKAFANPFYAAIAMMANLADLSSLEVYTNYWV